MITFKPRKLSKTGRNQRWHSISIPSIIGQKWSEYTEVIVTYSDVEDCLKITPVKPVPVTTIREKPNRLWFE